MNYRLAKDRLECRVTLLVVWYCVSHLVASFVAQWTCMAERNFGQTSVSLRLNRTSATCACRGFVRCLKSSCFNVGVATFANVYDVDVSGAGPLSTLP